MAGDVNFSRVLGSCRYACFKKDNMQLGTVSKS